MLEEWLTLIGTIQPVSDVEEEATCAGARVGEQAGRLVFVSR